MREMLERIDLLAREGRVGALAGVIASSGSLPMSRRASLLVQQDGSAHGTVGGGCLEAEILALAAGVCRGGDAMLGRFTLTESKAGAEGLNCGGTVRILIRSVGAVESAGVYRAAIEALDRGEECVIMTALDPGTAHGADRSQGARPVRILGTGLAGWAGLRAGCGVLDPSASEAGRIGRVLDAAQELLGTERSALVARGDAGGKDTVRYFLESVTHAPVVYLFGAGHVGRAVAGVARCAGFRVVVVDDRPEFASPERFPDADRVLVLPLRGAIGQLPVDSGAFILAVTRGHQHDEPVIEEALRTPARYIGMIGSRRKKAIMMEGLRRRGATEDQIARVHCPVGLPIGADSPGEIAVSIVAEMIRVRREDRPARSRDAGARGTCAQRPTEPAARDTVAGPARGGVIGRS